MAREAGLAVRVKNLCTSRKHLICLLFLVLSSTSGWSDTLQDIKAELDRMPKIGQEKIIPVQVDIVTGDQTEAFDAITPMGEGYEFVGSELQWQSDTGQHTGPAVSGLDKVRVASEDQLRELRQESTRVSGKVMGTNGAVSGEAEAEMKKEVSRLNAHIASLSGEAVNAVRVRATATPTFDFAGFRNARGQVHCKVLIKAVYRGSISDLRSRLALYQNILDFSTASRPSVNQPVSNPGNPSNPGGNSGPGNRLLSVLININGTDDESIGPDEHGSVSLNRTITLSDSQPHHLPNPPNGDLRWGGECRVELLLTARRLDNGDVGLDGVALLFEGTSESSTDLDGKFNFSVAIPRGQIVTHQFRVNNTDEGGDFADISLSIQNSDL